MMPSSLTDSRLIAHASVVTARRQRLLLDGTVDSDLTALCPLAVSRCLPSRGLLLAWSVRTPPYAVREDPSRISQRPPRRTAGPSTREPLRCSRPSLALTPRPLRHSSAHREG